jgi:hypothetical protein
MDSVGVIRGEEFSGLQGPRQRIAVQFLHAFSVGSLQLRPITIFMTLNPPV